MVIAVGADAVSGGLLAQRLTLGGLATPSRSTSGCRAPAEPVHYPDALLLADGQAPPAGEGVTSAVFAAGLILLAAAAVGDLSIAGVRRARAAGPYLRGAAGAAAWRRRGGRASRRHGRPARRPARAAGRAAGWSPTGCPACSW